MILHVLGHRYHYEMENLCRAFYPTEVLRVVKQGNAPKPKGRLRVTKPSPVVVTRVDDRLHVQLRIGGKTHTLIRPKGENNELIMAKMLFVLLRRATGNTPPWGLLTGVRPSKLMLRLRRDVGPDDAEHYFRNTLWVSEEKTRLAAQVAQAEEPVIAQTSARSFSLYLAIPFCPSRCAYCSFNI